MKVHLIAIAAGCFAMAANAQYARPGAVSPPKAAATAAPAKGPMAQPASRVSSPAAGAGAPAATPTPAPAAPPAGPFCFENANPRDAALTAALRANGLLCPAVTGRGVPMRLLAAPNGGLVGAEGGPPTVLHRDR